MRKGSTTNSKRPQTTAPSTTLASSSSLATNSSDQVHKSQRKGKKGGEAPLPLQDVICCVETLNSDGIDSSNSHAQTLKALGAQVETGGIRAGLTHMIWSNGNIKHLKAAEFMDIVVVSPLWIEQCRESCSKAPEKDFLVTSENVIVASSTSKSKVSEPMTDAAKSLPEPSSPSLDSSKRAPKSQTRVKEPKAKATKISPPKNLKATKLPKKSAPSHDPTASDSEVDDEIEETSPVIETKTAPKRAPKGSQTLPPPSTCRLIALSGFEGEERVFLTDLVQSIMTCVGPRSSSSSTSVSDIGLIPDNDFSLSSLKGCSYIVASTSPMRRSLRILFGMVMRIPIVTEEWLHSCLENRQWVNPAPYLHPRFDRSKASNKKTSSSAVFVAVGKSSDPSLEIVRNLTQSWDRARLVSSVSEADFIVVDNQNSAEPTVYEMRSYLSNLFKDTTEVDAALTLLEDGNILTCKNFFDCIEAGELQAHPYGNNSNPRGKNSKTQPSTVTVPEPQAKSNKRSRKGTPKKAKSPVEKERNSPESPLIEPINLSIPVEDSPPLPPITKIVPSPRSESRNGKVTVTPQPRAFSINFTDDEEDEEEASPTPRKKRSRPSTSPIRSRLISSSKDKDSEEEWDENHVSPSREEASPSW